MDEWTDVQACTLPTVERPVRQAEFDGLFKDVLDVERVPPHEARLRLRRDAEVIGRAAVLAAQETACCSFFTFGLSIGTDAAVMTVTVVDGHEQVLAAFVDRAKQVAA